ncbi:MAG: hypothetical protein N3G20_04275 [Verrucomicrobiae bacterium]|nr:hypothetical protein [Verrucomicrobiae bacterium]
MAEEAWRSHKEGEWVGSKQTGRLEAAGEHRFVRLKDTGRGGCDWTEALNWATGLKHEGYYQVGSKRG